MNKGELLKQAEKLGIDPATLAPTADSAAPERARSPRPNEAARAFAVQAARIMDENLCTQISVLDLRGVSPVCDYFVIGTGTSERQMRAVADHIKEWAKSQDERPYGVGGYSEATWIILDYVDVVIHLFNEHQRAYYDLETLWGDSPNVTWTRANE